MNNGEFDALPNYSQCYMMSVEIVSNSDHMAIIHCRRHCIIFYEIYAVCPSPCGRLLPYLAHLLHALQCLLMCQQHYILQACEKFSKNLRPISD